jgi:hypothetical protein
VGAEAERVETGGGGEGSGGKEKRPLEGKAVKGRRKGEEDDDEEEGNAERTKGEGGLSTGRPHRECVRRREWRSSRGGEDDAPESGLGRKRMRIIRGEADVFREPSPLKAGVCSL